jgi:hypothetical protein
MVLINSAGVQAGAVFVDLECEKYLTGIMNELGLPKEERDDYLRIGVKDFESNAKKAFESIEKEHRVDLGCRLVRPDLKIRRGAITLSG